MALRVNTQRDRIIRIAKFTLLHAAPDKFSRGIDFGSLLFHDLRDPAQAVVGELTPLGRAGVVNRDQTISPVPLESAG